MNIKNLFTKAFLFPSSFEGLHRADKILGIAAAAFIIVGIIIKVVAVKALVPATKKYLNKFYNLFLTIGIMLGVWYGCAYEQLRILNYRIFPAAILLLGFVWFVRILIPMLKHYSQEKAEYEKEQLKLKYLPK